MLSNAVLNKLAQRLTLNTTEDLPLLNSLQGINWCIDKVTVKDVTSVPLVITLYVVMAVGEYAFAEWINPTANLYQVVQGPIHIPANSVITARVLNGTIGDLILMNVFGHYEIEPEQ